MISTLTGRVAALSLDSLVLEVNGIGYGVRTTPQLLASTRHGAELTLHTELVVREDSLTLFGFAQSEELEIFRLVQSVSGIGPRIALAVLTVLSPDDVRRAVAEQDAKAIARTPGIGPKVASRLILELSGKLAPQPAEGSAEVPSGEAAEPPATGVDRDVLEALTGLGWPEKAGRDAVAEAREALESEGESAPDAGALLRSALRRLGGSR